MDAFHLLPVPIVSAGGFGRDAGCRVSPAPGGGYDQAAGRLRRRGASAGRVRPGLFELEQSSCVSRQRSRAAPWPSRSAGPACGWGALSRAIIYSKAGTAGDSSILHLPDGFYLRYIHPAEQLDYRLDVWLLPGAARRCAGVAPLPPPTHIRVAGSDVVQEILFWEAPPAVDPQPDEVAVFRVREEHRTRPGERDRFSAV